MSSQVTATLISRVSDDDTPAAIVCSPCGRYLYTAGLRAPFEVKSYALLPISDHLEMVGVVATHSDEVYTLSVSSDGTLLASGGYDRVLLITHPHTGVTVQRIAQSTKLRQGGSITCSAFANNDTFFVYGLGVSAPGVHVLRVPGEGESRFDPWLPVASFHDLSKGGARSLCVSPLPSSSSNKEPTLRFFVGSSGRAVQELELQEDGSLTVTQRHDFPHDEPNDLKLTWVTSMICSRSGRFLLIARQTGVQVVDLSLPSPVRLCVTQPVEHDAHIRTLLLNDDDDDDDDDVEYVVSTMPHDSKAGAGRRPCMTVAPLEIVPATAGVRSSASSSTKEALQYVDVNFADVQLQRTKLICAVPGLADHLVVSCATKSSIPTVALFAFERK